MKHLSATTHGEKKKKGKSVSKEEDSSKKKEGKCGKDAINVIFFKPTTFDVRRKRK